jgi:hypothetical protein
MNLYLVEARDAEQLDYESTRSLVVRAENEQQARRLADEAATAFDSNQRGVFLRPEHAFVSLITLYGDPGVIHVCNESA